MAEADVIQLVSGHQAIAPVRNQVTDDDTVDVLASEIEFVFEPSTGGIPRLYRKRVLWSDFVNVVVDEIPNGVVAGFLTVPAGTVIVKVQWRIVEAFTDTFAQAIDLNLDAGTPSANTVCDTPTNVVSAGFPNADLVELPASGVERALILSNGATLDAVMPNWADDGDAGIADLYILLGTAVTL